MTTLTINGKDYRLPEHLTDWQQSLYVHLINWKWQHITEEPGVARGHEYDAILPESCLRAGTSPLLYPGIAKAFARHREKNPLRLHLYFHHMASSQAATVNLFLPILQHRDAHAILRALKPDLFKLAKAQLDNGFCLEYWGQDLSAEGPRPGDRGPLNDKSRAAGTDADLAIAYYNLDGELCLWLIEHKLTEKEFTDCGGFRSKGRKPKHDCSKGFGEILRDKSICYYHDVNKYRYWDITGAHRSLFVGGASTASCPFRGGMNQLWRNQLLGLAIERDKKRPFQHSTFSVVRHPGNTSLERTLKQYENLIGDDPRFTVLTSADVVRAAEEFGGADLRQWTSWYRGLYML